MSEGEEVGQDVELGLSYREALDELDDILAQLESSAVDVDVLAERVARGAVLVRYCRQRLRVVRSDVDAVVDDLLDDAPTDGTDAAAVDKHKQITIVYVNLALISFLHIYRAKNC